MSLFDRPRHWWRDWQVQRVAETLRREHVGPHSHLDPSVQVLGWPHVRIGHHTLIGADTWINVNNRTSKNPEVLIGDNCFVGRRNFLNAGSRLVLGDYCLTGPDCHFLGADHQMPTPFAPYASTGATKEGVIEVGANCWFGSSVIVLKDVRIGFGCVLGAGAVVVRDVPPCSVVVGSPARVIKRFDVRASAWVKPDDFPEDGDSLLPTAEAYLADLRQKFPAIKGPRPAMGKMFGDA